MIASVDKYLIEGCMRCELGATPDCKVHNWKVELQLLRSIVLDCGLTEEVKWGVPCYTDQGKNIVIVSAFKEYAAVSFFKGSLLKDEQNLLIKPGENSQASRYFKFTDVDQVAAAEQTLKDYILEAVKVERAGLKVPFKKNPEPIPEELQNRLDEDLVLKDAFEKLTPGRQRGYIIFISAPKQSITRESRIDKCVGKILNGEGLNDKYSRKRALR